MRALQITQSSQHTGGWGSRIAVEIKASLGLQVSSRAAWAAYRMRPYKKREEKEKEKHWLDMTRHGGGEEGNDRRGNGEKKMRVKQKYKKIHHHWAGRRNTPHPHSRSWQPWGAQLPPPCSKSVPLPPQSSTFLQPSQSLLPILTTNRTVWPLNMLRDAFLPRLIHCNCVCTWMALIDLQTTSDRVHLPFCNKTTV